MFFTPWILSQAIIAAPAGPVGPAARKTGG
jgi:hypothetical protein